MLKTIQDVRPGELLVDPDNPRDKPFRVTEVHLRPDGCRYKVHVNRSMCFDWGTEVITHQRTPNALSSR